MLTPNIMPKLSVGRIGRETSDKITRSFGELLSDRNKEMWDALLLQQ